MWIPIPHWRFLKAICEDKDMPESTVDEIIVIRNNEVFCTYQYE